MLYIFGNVANHSTREPHCCLLGIKHLSFSRKKALWCCFESFDNVVLTILINSEVWTVIFFPITTAIGPKWWKWNCCKIEAFTWGWWSFIGLKEFTGDHIMNLDHHKYSENMNHSYFQPQNILAKYITIFSKIACKYSFLTYDLRLRIEW